MNDTILNNYGDHILKDYTHNEFGNPHSQYVVNQKELTISPYKINGKFYKLLSVEMEDLEKMDILAAEFKTIENDMTIDEIDRKNKLQENRYKISSYKSAFEIIFDVYESSYNGCNQIDDKWELFLKISHSRRFVPQSIKVKLMGKARKAIVIARESIRSEEYRYEKYNLDGEIEYKTKQVDIPIIIYDLFIVMDDEEEEINFVQKFCNTNIKRYKIYNRSNCINYVPKTEEEKEFLKRQIESFDKENNVYNKEQESDLVNILANSTEVIVNKFVSRNEFDQINLPCVPNYFRLFIELFEINMKFDDVYYSSYSGVWEVLVDDASGAIEFREEDGHEYMSIHETGYFKFMITAANTRLIDNKDKYIFELQLLESKNTEGKELYVDENSDTGRFGIWLKANYPQRVTLRPCISNGEYDEYNKLRLRETAEYVSFIPSRAKLVSLDTGRYIYHNL